MGDDVEPNRFHQNSRISYSSEVTEGLRRADSHTSETILQPSGHTYEREACCRVHATHHPVNSGVAAYGNVETRDLESYTPGSGPKDGSLVINVSVIQFEKFFPDRFRDQF